MKKKKGQKSKMPMKPMADAAMPEGRSMSAMAKKMAKKRMPMRGY